MTSYEELIAQAEGLLERNDEASAIEIYRRATEENPQRGEAYYGLGLAYASLDNPEQARESFRQAAERMPYDQTTFYNWGAMAFKTGKLEEAQEAFRRALDLKENYTEALYALGRVYEESGWFVDAKLALIKALQICPGLEKARETLRRVEARLAQPGGLDRYHRILIVMDQGIGNMVMFTPTIRAIKEQLPKAHITVLGRQPSVQVIEGWDMVDQVLTQPDDRSYDIGFLTIWSQDYNQLYGERIRGQCRTIYTINMDNVDSHEVDHHLKIARLLGYTGPRPETFCMVKDVDVPYSGKLAGLSDTTVNNGDWERKRWPYYPELARRLLERGYTVVLIGGKGEAERFRPEDWPDGVINALGKYDIRETAGLIRRCELFIGNDSGPAHMAAALGVKTFVIFGATRTTKNRPYGENVKVISKFLPCSPCQYTPRWSSCSDWRCMRDLGVDDVLNAIF